MAERAKTDYRKWLVEILPKHERLAVAVRPLLENMLKKKNIEYLSVGSRVKNLDGALEKIGRKQYSDPSEQLTDLSGIRVITYLEQQVEAISKVVRDLFDVDELNSLDRAEILGGDKVGYRSTHFVCSVGKKRESLPEYESLGNLRFEIQVRTVLQHAWAELAHDRSFKFGATLPIKIQRKLNLYAGMLEIVDSSFDEISKEIDRYKQFLDSRTITEIEKVEVDSISLNKFVSYLTSRNKIRLVDEICPTFLIREIKEAGISTIGDLKKIASPSFVKAYKSRSTPGDLCSFIRLLLLYDDIHRLDIMRGIKRFSASAFDFLAKKHGKSAIENEFTKRDIVIEKLETLPIPIVLSKSKLTRPRSAKNRARKHKTGASPRKDSAAKAD
jgi:ppGpp synthetase/RelA/SpoT-type nucleotidyltranferase